VKKEGREEKENPGLKFNPFSSRRRKRRREEKKKNEKVKRKKFSKIKN